MKFFKNTLSLVLLFAVGSTSPRQMGGAAIPAQKSAPAQPVARPAVQPAPSTTSPSRVPTTGQSFSILLNQLRALRTSDDVLPFLKREESSIAKLHPALREALFIAGVNLHEELSGINRDDIDTLITMGNIFANKSFQQPTRTQNVPTTTPAIQPKQVIPSLPRVQTVPATKPITPTPVQPIKPVTPIKPIEPILPPTMKDQVPRDLLGKVKKLEGYNDIYVGAGISAEKEPIFFAMEKLNNERLQVWQKYTNALLGYNRTQIITELRKLTKKCDDKAFLETLKNDPYTKKLMEQMCASENSKKKFSFLFGSEDGIGGGIVGLDQMLYRYKDDGEVIYVAYASSEPITGPFKPKEEINLSSFTLKDFETAYSNLILCVGVDMMQKLKLPISTEHRGIFKNPFNEIRGTYKKIGLQLHGFAGTVEEQLFNKKYMTVFPTGHATKLFHSEIKKGEMYLGTDKKPFPYETYYKDEELKKIQEKFPPIKQELIGDTPTTSAGGGFEFLHVLPLNTLSKYYTNQ